MAEPRAENSVLHPVRVHALPVGHNGLACAGVRFDYSRLAGDDMGGGPNPDAVELPPRFSSVLDDGKLEKGVHVRWELPPVAAAGEKSVADGGEAIDFPAVPNRWLVTRLSRDGGRWRPRHWLVESDRLETVRDSRARHNAGSRTVFYPKDRSAFHRYLGRGFPYDAGTTPPDPRGEYLDKLTAVLPDDLAFSSYYPGCRNVFGFHDALDDLRMPAAPVELAYFVCGWYADPATDPLKRLAAMGEEGRARAGIDLSAWPDAPDLVCHGYVAGLTWKGDTAPYPSGLPGTFPEAALGFTSAQALAALSSADGFAGAHLLLAGDFDRLDAAQGEREARYAELESFFAHTVRGNLYTVKRTPDWRPAAGQENAEIAAGPLLAAVNDAASRAHRAEADVAVWRREAYDLWRRRRALVEGDRGDPTPALAECVQGIERGLRERNACRRAVCGGLVALRRTLGEGYAVKAVPDEAFHGPEDPTLLLRGEAVADDDGARGDDEPVPCRRADEVMRPRSGWTQFFSSAYPLRHPAVWPALIEEAMLLSDRQPSAPGGRRPAPEAVTAGPAPWRSVHLNWRASYRPDPDLAPVVPDSKGNARIPQWRLQNLDYRPGPVGLNTGPPVDLPGSAIITRHVPRLLERQLDRVAESVRDDPLRARLDGLADRARTLPVKSQRLSGLNDKLLGRATGLAFPVDDYAPRRGAACDAVAGWVADEYRHVPDPAAKPARMRGGVYEIDALALVDAFGRLLARERPEVHVPAELSCPRAGAMLLPPRLVESTRLDLRFLGRDAGGGFSVPDSPFEGASCVAGWLIPDWLDRGVMLYDADGTYLGKAKSAGAAGTVDIEPVPGGAPAPAPEMGRFLDALRRCRGEELAALFAAIEQCPGVHNAENAGLVKGLALFAGKPLALVKVSLGLGVLSRAASPSRVPPLDGVRFPVTLGDREHLDDGLVGFFVDNDRGYHRFHNCTTSKTPATCRYIVDHPGVSLPLSHAAPSPVRLTLLVDPTSRVHIVGGLWPVKTVRVPEHQLKTICDRIRVVRETRYALDPDPESADASAPPEIPHAEFDGIRLSWHEREAGGGWAVAAEPREPPPPGRQRLSAGSTLRDGYLVHETAPSSDPDQGA